MAKSVVIFANDRTRASRLEFVIGEEKGHHTHEHEYVAGSIRDGDLRVINDVGVTIIST